MKGWWPLATLLTPPQIHPRLHTGYTPIHLATAMDALRIHARTHPGYTLNMHPKYITVMTSKAILGHLHTYRHTTYGIWYISMPYSACRCICECIRVYLGCSRDVARGVFGEKSHQGGQRPAALCRRYKLGPGDTGSLECGSSLGQGFFSHREL